MSRTDGRSCCYVPISRPRPRPTDVSQVAYLTCTLCHVCVHYLVKIPIPSSPLSVGLSKIDGIRRPSFHSKCRSVPRCFRSFQRRQTDRRGAADGQTKVTVLGSFTRQSEAHLLPMEFRTRPEQTDMTSSLPPFLFLFVRCNVALSRAETRRCQRPLV